MTDADLRNMCIMVQFCLQTSLDSTDLDTAGIETSGCRWHVKKTLSDDKIVVD